MSQYPLRGLSKMMEGQRPSDSHSLVHIRPREAAMLAQITGRNDYMPNSGIRKFADGGGVGTSGLRQYAQQLGSSGRGGDTELAYVRPEHIEILRRMGDGTINPRTGLQEFGLFSAIGKVIKGVGKAVKAVAKSPIGRIVAITALSVLAPGIGTALGMSAGFAGSAAWTGIVSAVGTTGLTKLAGASWGDALKQGAFAGVTAGAIKGFTNGGNWMGGGAPPAAAPAPSTSLSTAPTPGSPSDLAAAGLPTGSNPLSQLAQSQPPPGAISSTVPQASLGFQNSLANAGGAGAGAAGGTGAASAGVAAKSGNWLTDPLFFKDTAGMGGQVGRALTSPLALGVGALALSAGGGGGNAGDFDNNGDNLIPDPGRGNSDEVNNAYINAMKPGPLREALNPNDDPYKYGYGPAVRFWRDAPVSAATGGGIRRRYAEGGPTNFEGAVRHHSGGQDDKVYLGNAQLAGGEFVFDATTVADAGDGNTEAGFKVLEDVRQHIRNKKGRRHKGPIPPKMGGLAQLKKVLG